MQHAGWAQSFNVLGLAGVACAAACSLVLPRLWRASEHGRGRQAPAGVRSLDGETLAHLAVLCFTHSVVSFSFFVLQAWIPTFLASTGMSRLSSIGLFSALPWLVSGQHACRHSYVCSLRMLHERALRSGGTICLAVCFASAIPRHSCLQATAVVSVLAGAGADRLQSRHGWTALRVRHLMQSLAAGGTAVRWES